MKLFSNWPRYLLIFVDLVVAYTRPVAPYSAVLMFFVAFVLFLVFDKGVKSDYLTTKFRERDLLVRTMWYCGVLAMLVTLFVLLWYSVIVTFAVHSTPYWQCFLVLVASDGLTFSLVRAGQLPLRSRRLTR